MTSATHVERTGELRYHGGTWDHARSGTVFRALDDAILDVDRPYNRLPRVRLDLGIRTGSLGLELPPRCQYVNFHLSVQPPACPPRDPRRPSASTRRQLVVRRHASARTSSYRLPGQVAGWTARRHLAGLPGPGSGLHSIARSVLRRRCAARPRLFSVPAAAERPAAVRRRDHDFRSTTCSREKTRWPDQVADANQLIADHARDRRYARRGTVPREHPSRSCTSEDRDVTLPGQAAIDSSASSWSPNSRGWAMTGTAALGCSGIPTATRGRSDRRWRKISYRDDRRRVFNAAYRLRRHHQQTDLAFLWPVSESLNLIGRHYWSLQDDRLLGPWPAWNTAPRAAGGVRAVARKCPTAPGDDHNLARACCSSNWAAWAAWATISTARSSAACTATELTMRLIRPPSLLCPHC